MAVGCEDTEEHAPAEVFAALANPTRISILEALWTAEEPLSFTDLYKRSDVEDSGGFNYHLGKLVGRFVTLAGEEYRLSVAGRAVLQVIAAGMLTDRQTFGPDHLDEACPFCGGTVQVAYADERLTARCLDCPGTHGNPFPPGTYFGIELPPSVLWHDDPGEVLRAGYAYYKARTMSMVSGVCSECAGPVDVDVQVCPDHDPGDAVICDVCDSRYLSWAAYACRVCRYSRRHPVWYRLLTIPRVLAFWHANAEADVPPMERLLLEDVPVALSDIEEEVVSEDPLEVALCVRADGRELRVVLDANLDLVDVG